MRAEQAAAAALRELTDEQFVKLLPLVKRLSGYHVEPSAIVAPQGTVVLYTKNHCGKSKSAMKLLDEAGIRYEERNIDLTPSAREEFRALEAGGVPVIVIGDRKIVGWDRDAYAYFVEATGFK